MRYTSSMFVATILSLLTFLGMSLLIANPKFQKSTNIEMVDFTKIADVKKSTVKPVKKTPPPKPAKAKQPPAAPALDIAQNNVRPVIEATPNQRANKKFDLTQFKSPILNNDYETGNSPLDNGLRQLLPIQPVYPPIALRNKVEGWVKVEFVVNEFGQVINAKVVDSKPKHIFNAATIKAIYKSKFKPLVVNGKAMSQTAIQIIEFKIQD